MSQSATVRSSAAQLLLLALFGLGCITTKGVRVDSATQRGPYLDAVLRMPEQQRRFLFPASPKCRAVLNGQRDLSYETLGSFGQIYDDDRHCIAVGVGSLSFWRKGREAGEMSPSSAASWTIVHEDNDVLLLRGRFPLTRRVGLPISGDAVVMVANDEICSQIAATGASNLIYHTSGLPVLALGRCPVIAVAAPL